MASLIEIDHPEDGIARLTFNRPEQLNAMTCDLVDEMHQALDTLHADHDVRVVIVTGAGRAFCAGIDLNGFGVVPGTEDFGEAQRGMAIQQHIADVVQHLRAIRQPTIAAINGPAVGGGLAWALGCEIRYCSESAKIGTGFIKLGLSGCDMGTSWLLPRLIGASRAWELTLTGRVFDGAEAERLGLVSRMVPDDELMDRCLEVAREIASNSPFGTWMTKEVLWSNLEISTLNAGIDLENRTQIMTGMTADSKEAVEAALARRPVNWRNR